MQSRDLDGPCVEPQNGRAAALVVLCHGYGSDGNDLIALAGAWRPLMPRAAFVAPHAPERCPIAGAGFQWFALSTFTPEVVKRGVEAAAPVLERFLALELERHGLDGARLALVGFSQGAMMALHVGLRRKPAPAAIVSFSGALAATPPSASHAERGPPILLVHGDADDMIPIGAMHAALAVLATSGLSVRWHVAEGVGHGIDQESMEIAGRFLADALGAARR
jgi:phospholipase/carboxylesterase